MTDRTYAGPTKMTVQLDGSHAEIEVPAKELEAWPAIGQQICWLKSLNAEVAIVEKFLGKCIHDPARRHAVHQRRS